LRFGSKVPCNFIETVIVSLNFRRAHSCIPFL